MEQRALLAALKRRREKTVDLGGGKTVTFLRPPESEMGGLLKTEGDSRTWLVGVEQVRKYVTGWSGFSEATILGESVGSSDPLEFSADLWAELAADNIEWSSKVAAAILEAVVAHVNAQAATAGNSAPA